MSFRRVVCLLAAFALGGSLPQARASQAVELTWNPSPDPNIVNYNVHFGTESRTVSGSYPQCVTFADVSDVTIPGLQSGQTYYFAVSAIDAAGNESELSNEAVYNAPASLPLVLQVQATAQGSQDVQLTWSASPESDVYGYTVYYGTESGVYTNSVVYYGTTLGIMTGLAGGATYYFVVAAVDSYSVETNFSNEVVWSVPPAVPLVLQAQAASLSARDVQLTWNPSPNSDVYGYMIYYWAENSLNTNSAVFYFVTNGVIHGLVGGETYYFAAAVIDGNGVENIFSNVASYAVPLPTPMVLKTEVYADGNGQAYLMEIHTDSAVSGNWEMDYSTDLQNWSYFTSGFGAGNGDGYDVDAYVWMNPSQMFFRVFNY